MLAGADAEYDAIDNTIYVKRNFDFSNVENQAIIIHECVHAIVDAARASGTFVLAEESAAYIAQCLYRLRLQTGQNLQNFIAAAGTTPDGRIFSEAVSVIDKFHLDENPFGNKAIQYNDYQDLRMAINAHDLYNHLIPTTLSTANGLRRDRTPTMVINNLRVER